MSRRLAAVAQAVLSSLVMTSILTGAEAQVEAPFQNREEREIYGDTNGSGSILDAANPMDLFKPDSSGDGHGRRHATLRCH